MKISEMIESQLLCRFKKNNGEVFYGYIVEADKDYGRLVCYLAESKEHKPNGSVRYYLSSIREADLSEITYAHQNHGSEVMSAEEMYKTVEIERLTSVLVDDDL